MFLSLVTVGNIQQVTADFAKVLSDKYFWIKTENSTICSTALIKKRSHCESLLASLELLAC